MVRTDISTNGQTDLYVVRKGVLNAHIYRDEILQSFGLFYAAAIGNMFILMDDNACLSRTNIIETCLQQMASVFSRSESD